MSTPVAASISTNLTDSNSSSGSQYSPSPNVRRLKWGIFDVAYEVPSFEKDNPQRLLSFFNLWRLVRLRVWSCREAGLEPTGSCSEVGDDSGMQQWRSALGATLRLLTTILSFAPWPAFQYMACLVWMAISPAVALYLAFCTLMPLERAITNSASTPLGRGAVREEISFYLVLWMGSAFLSSWASRELEEQKLILGGHMRSHFLPLLVDSSLYKEARFGCDDDAESLDSYLPSPWSFGTEVPAWKIINDLGVAFRDTLTLIYEVVAIMAIVRHSPLADAVVFTLLTGLVLVIVRLAPSNGVGGVGYTFWTANKSYHRLLALYTIAFDENYRDAIVKDGLSEHLSSEYRAASEALGPVKANLLSLACSLPPPWYWTQAQTIVTEYPMILCLALYVLLCFNSLSISSLVAISVFQYGINSLTKAVGAFKNGRGANSILIVMKSAEKFMKVVETVKSNDTRELGERESLVDYRETVKSSNGMRISLHNVSLRYPNESQDALTGISVEIKTGEFVLLVGVNGSGKSSLLKVLAGLLPPTSGEVKVNQRALREYAPSTIRQAISFVSHSEPIYPLSLAENIFIGLGDDLAQRGLTADARQRMVHEAAEIVGCTQLLQRLGEDTILNPCRVVGQSLKGCGNGDIGKAAFREWKRNDPSQCLHTLSPGEKQRLVLARSLMRIQNRETDLIVVDEGTSSLDPVAENSIIDYLNSIRQGKTMVFVTHRPRSFAQKADRIICMDKGRIVQVGSHSAELMAEDGPYRDLFSPETGGLN